MKTKRRISSFLVLVMLFSLFFDNGALFMTQTVKAATKMIDVWDIAGVNEENTGLYVNHISSGYWDSSDSVNSKGAFQANNGSLETTIDDLTINYVANDRLYNSAEGAVKTYGTYAKSIYEFEDGYQSKAIYYCNGTGGAARRYLQIANVKQGDKISVYAGTSNNVTETLNFVNVDGTQKDTASVTSVPSRVDFVATEDGTFKIYSDTANGGKFMYYRVVRTPAVTVTGSLDMSAYDISDKDYQVMFVNQENEQETYASIKNGNFEVQLAAGYTYTAVLTGVTGYGFTNDTCTLTTTISQVQTGSSSNILKVGVKQMNTYKGNIVGFADTYNLDNLKVTFIASEESNAQDVEAVISGTAFEATLEAGVDYTITVSGVNDYQVDSDTAVNINKDVEKNIQVSLKPQYSATGSMIGLPNGTKVTGLIFENLEDSYAYEGSVNGATYSVELRDGSYSVSAIVDGYKTNSHVVIAGKDVTKDLLFVTADKVEETLEWVSDVYVGYPDKAYNYTTVNEAVAACKAMNPVSEEQRITVHIAPGVYREQIIVETPYLTFVNDETTEEVKLTWYYGIGYRYYSADETGYYNYENQFDRFEKNIASKWGVGTYIKSTATAFRAEGITFEASFNRYVTEEELADGVEVSGTESIRFDRTESGADVASKAATERASALCVDADQAEFFNCSFLGSQDTLYTGGDASRSYYKDCVIEGNTDYIFGDGDVVFDSCELKWYGYSSNATAGYITANRPNYAQNGYLFKNCTITGNKTSNMSVVAGYLGRPWGANAKVTFYNTTLEKAEYITSAGWTSMSGNLAENANYKEYNTMLSDGTSADVSGRITGVLTEDPQIEDSTYFGDWTPAYYDKSAEEEDDSEKHTIWVIGDSTVSAFNDAYYYPRYGWGTQLQNYIDSNKYEVVNLAISGTSSKDFTTHTEYQTLLNGMSEGDFLFIGFGHNDEKTEEARYTNPNGDYTTAGSFANSLYTNYIVPANEKGCTTILCTPIVRRTATTEWANSNLHITSDAVGFPGGDYSQAIRDLGKDLDIAVVDLTAMTKELYDTLGVEQTQYLHAWTSSKASSIDNTHTNIWGGAYNAYFVAKTVASLNIKGLSKAVIASKIASAPTKEATLTVNPSYVEKPYDNNLAQSTLWNDFGIWKGTVFGAVGSKADISKTNFTLGSDENGDMNIAVANNKGKIANAQDGIAMYYYKVPVGSTFSLSATATVNSFVSNDQVTFGLMARDDMYIDTVDSSVLGDFVAAAPLKLTKTGSIWNCFARKSGVLTQGGKCTTQSITEGESYDLKIVSNTDGYACTFGTEKTISAGFDFQLTSVDSDYVYVGMFVARNADVTFSNIKLLVDGKEVTATPEVSEAPTTSEAPATSEIPETSTVPSVSPSAPTKVVAPVIKKDLPQNTDGTTKVYIYPVKANTTKLSVTAIGKNLTYQWYSNTKNTYSKATKIKGATTASYIPSSSSMGTKYYFVKITSNDSTKDVKTASINSNIVKVVVKKVLTKPAHPVIKKNLPKNANGTKKVYTYNIGEKATKLSVSATGKKISYQWYYSTTGSYTDAVKISGATKSYYVPSTKVKSRKYYFVKITNTDTTKDVQKITVYSRLVKVTVKKPVVSIKSENITVKAGTSKKLSVTVFPTDASNKKVAYKSSNSKYATVSSTGVVTAKKAGKGKIVAIKITSSDNSKIIKNVTVKIL